MARDERVAAIVVAHNGGDDLLACVRSVLAQTIDDLEVIVVDNASEDGSVERLEAALGQDVRVVRRPINGGYGAGANSGWRATEAPIVAILNQDLMLEPDCLKRMRQVLVDEPRDALVSPKLVLKSDPSRVNAIGNDVHLSGVTWCHGLGTDSALWQGVEEVTAISGAAFLVRRSFLATLGGFEETYFMYMEDVDLSLRARLAGGVCLGACDAVATHDWALDLTAEKFGYLERNRRRMWKRLFRRCGVRAKIVLLQAEGLGWLYALIHGREYVAAKARRARSAPPTSPLLVSGEASRRLANELAATLPYSVVTPGIPGISLVGGAIDRAVVRLAGMSRERRPTGLRPS
jgi:GT2 family glycosyltransferase